MQKETPVSTVTRLKCGIEYPTIKEVPHDEKGKMGMLPQASGRNCARVGSPQRGPAFLVCDRSANILPDIVNGKTDYPKLLK